MNVLSTVVDLAVGDTLQVWADNSDIASQPIRASVGTFDTFFTVAKFG